MGCAIFHDNTDATEFIKQSSPRKGHLRSKSNRVDFQDEAVPRQGEGYGL